jgi:hypothetical protein
MPAREARRLVGPNLTLGVTCRSSLDLARRAVEDGADYAAFGAFFPSTAKQVTSLAAPEVLRRWSQQTRVPSCAIGGITAANLAPLVRMGADSSLSSEASGTTPTVLPLTTGCVGAAELVRALGQDPASVCVSVTTIYGKGTACRVGGSASEVKAGDGEVTVTSK